MSKVEGQRLKVPIEDSQHHYPYTAWIQLPLKYSSGLIAQTVTTVLNLTS